MTEIVDSSRDEGTPGTYAAVSSHLCLFLPARSPYTGDRNFGLPARSNFSHRNCLESFPLKKQQLDPLLISQIFIPAVKPAAKCLITSLTSQFNVFTNAFIHKLNATQI